jgi:hypothetical protein
VDAQLLTTLSLWKFGFGTDRSAHIFSHYYAVKYVLVHEM